MPSVAIELEDVRAAASDLAGNISPVEIDTKVGSKISGCFRRMMNNHCTAMAAMAAQFQAEMQSQQEQFLGVMQKIRNNAEQNQQQALTAMQEVKERMQAIEDRIDRACINISIGNKTLDLLDMGRQIREWLRFSRSVRF